ncbi:MAG: DEAD/DEAH box helicase [Acidobacteriota bacterium]|nr:DEAD/DEAH box helicase [Acidobacteriota bacterium]
METQTDENFEMTFAQFGLSEELNKAISDLGYEIPSPIQAKTIPLLLEGNDIIGQAQTGTGKTAAFALPTLQRIDTTTSKIQALVLTPTRELAIQVAEAFHSYAKHLGRVRVLPVYGGQSISQQIRHLRSGVQIVVGTPGRIMDHIRRETIDISNLKVVILDEADEMLNMGFQEDVEWILSHTPDTRQTALFSATMPRQVKRIAEKYLQNAVNVEIEQKTMTVPTIQQFYLNVSDKQKTDALTKLLETETASGEAVLIFHRTKLGAASLTDKLQARGYAAEAMHGDMSQAQREIVIKKLRSGAVEIVVATDVAARGLDVERIATVINFDMPSDTENYVHRIGRTGRAGRIGKAILFVTPRQQRMLRDIEKYTKQKIEPIKLPTHADVAARRVSMLKDRITATLDEQNLELYLSLVEDLAEETGRDAVEIAAAATFLAVGEKPLQVKVEPEQTRFSFSEEGMTRLFIDVGRRQQISPAHIVAAIANEADIPGKAIGAIDVNDQFTLVDVPAQFVAQILERMPRSRIGNQTATIRVANAETEAAKEFAAPRQSEFKRESATRERPFKRESVAPRERPTTKPPMRERRFDGEESFKPKKKFVGKSFDGEGNYPPKKKFRSENFEGERDFNPKKPFKSGDVAERKPGTSSVKSSDFKPRKSKSPYVKSSDFDTRKPKSTVKRKKSEGLKPKSPFAAFAKTKRKKK